MLFDVKPLDREIYQERIGPRLPERIIDCHTHVSVIPSLTDLQLADPRLVTWPSRVAKTNPIEHLLETYELLFPDKSVTPLIFSGIRPVDRMHDLNAYSLEASKKAGVPSLLYVHPDWSAEELERKLTEERRQGIKVYLNLAPSYIPAAEIRIFDFLTPAHLEVVDRLGLIVMLHIPRPDRLRDPVNLAQIMEIEEKFHNLRLIIAHVGRAYCNEDAGEAFEILKESHRLFIGLSANTNAWVFARTMEAVGPNRMLFGSDLPVVRMRMRRECRDGVYVNVVPQGMYGDVSADKNMTEVVGKEADELTFFLYEEILSILSAADEIGLSPDEVDQIFFANAKGMLESAGYLIDEEIPKR